MNSERYNSSKSKCILVYGQVPPPFHGSNIMTRFFLKALKNLGYDVKLSKKSFSKNIAEVNKIKLIKLIRFFSTAWRFLINIFKYKPTLIIFFISATKIGLIGETLFILIARIFQIPYILYLHSRKYRIIYSESIFFRRIILNMCNPATACFVLGRVLQEETKIFYKGRIYVLPNCIEDNLIVSNSRSNNLIKILFLSNLSESKGILTLIKAIPYVISRYKNVQFVIAGPWQEERIRKTAFDFIKKNNLDHYILFPGPLYEDVKDKMFASCDVFVFPTHYPHEAMSLVILEAMRAGLPVISTNIGAIPEIINDGETGFIISPENPNELSEKVIFLIENPDILKQMGNKGRERFVNYYSFEAYEANLKIIMDNLSLKKK